MELDWLLFFWIPLTVIVFAAVIIVCLAIKGHFDLAVKSLMDINEDELIYFLLLTGVK